MSIDPNRVYDNDDSVNPAFWTVLPPGSHGRVVNALSADAVVVAAIHASVSDPTNAAKRAFVIDHVNRATANCIGQEVIGAALAPEKNGATLYNLLTAGTAAGIDAILASPANTALTEAFVVSDPGKVLQTISRQTGRATFWALIDQGIAAAANPLALLSAVKSQLAAHLPHIAF